MGNYVEIIIPEYLFQSDQMWLRENEKPKRVYVFMPTTRKMNFRCDLGAYKNIIERT